MMDRTVDERTNWVVGIGASAGGIEALKTFFCHLPSNLPCAFVVQQHLDPSRQSRLPEILGAECPYPVVQAANGEKLQPGTVYCIPSESLVQLDGERLVLVPRELHEPGQRVHSIDQLLESLAQAYRQCAIAVILSGAGNDGARGVVAVRRKGGTVLVENPIRCGVPSMPQAAIAEGADRILDPEDIGAAIAQHIRQSEHKPAEEALRLTQESQLISDIVKLASDASGNNFKGYKTTTIVRRVERRMAMCNIASLADYRSLLQQDTEECKRLAEDMLISVTGFFRDPQAYDIMARQIIPDLFANRDDNQPLRVWIAGCATGEEAYSIAMLLFAERERLQKQNLIQVFASDIDAGALDQARAGFYASDEVLTIPPDLLQKYFTGEQQGYRVSKELRSSIVFALHNLLSDPPFSRLDLIVCRNVLIYLDQSIQRRLMSLFSAVLNPGGILFLGASETIGVQQDRFDTLSKQWRIFRNKGTSPLERRALMLQFPALSRMTGGAQDQIQAEAWTSSDRSLRKLVDQFGPALILLNADMEILYTRGVVQPYLTLSEGPPSYQLFSLLDPALRTQIRPLLSRVKSDQCRVELDSVVFQDRLIRIQAVPLPDQIGADLLLLMIDEQGHKPVAESRSAPEDSWLVVQLEQELQSTREDLQRTIEKMRTSNEDLMAMNEEFVAMNEELQSTNEELESSKEELQSLNEELQTSNNALDAKVLELEAVNNDLSNLFSSTDIATVFLDRDFNIKRFTPAAARLMYLKQNDIGRPFTDLAHVFNSQNLLEGAESVLQNAMPQQSEITSSSGSSFIKRILPYRTEGGPVMGVVITFVDVTALRQARDAAQTFAEQLRQQNQLLDLPLVFARDMEDRIIFWNSGAEKFYGYTREQALGRVSHEILLTQFPRPLNRILQTVREKGHWQGELIHTTAVGNQVTVSSYWVLARNPAGEPWAVLELNSDITDRKQFELELDYLANHDALTQLPNQKLLMEQLHNALVAAGNMRSKVALLLLDLDRFKYINDSLGHDVGNQVLVQAAERLRGLGDKKTLLARFGGDEFALLVEGGEAINQVSHLAEDVLQIMAKPFTLNQQELYLGASIGVAVYPDDARNADGIMRAADAALNMAKAEGRGQYQFFTPELNRRAHRQLALEVRLHKALASQEIYLEFQPQMDLRTGRIVGAEALMRWKNADLGQVSPVEFIPVAEECGVIIELGEWALYQVVQQLRQWQSVGRNDVRLSVNISPLQLRHAMFMEQIVQLMREGGFEPALLELELTERVLVNAPEKAIEFFAVMRSLGIQLSFDDFGTGYCSLQYLRHLHLNHLKVAREFVPQDESDSDNIAISRSIVSLAKSLEIQSTVEGVEGEQQLEFFRKLGCDRMQGYFFSPPVRIEQLEAMLRQEQQHRTA